MSAYQKETAFLREVIGYDGTSERHKLEERITEIQRHACCFRSAFRLMLLLIALAMAGLGYCAVFLKGFPGSTSHFLVKPLCVLGLGSLISLLMYTGYWLIYRQELDRRHEECRRVVAKLLASRLGEPCTPLLPEAAQEFESSKSKTETTNLPRT